MTALSRRRFLKGTGLLAGGLAGLAAAKEAARARGLELVPGIELSAFVLGREAHILGHFLRPEDPDIARFVEVNLRLGTSEP